MVGDLFKVDPAGFGQSALGWARRLGPLYELKIFDTRLRMVSGADLVAEVCDETRFTKHVGPALEALRAIGGDGLFTAYNDEPSWHRAHEVLLPAFASSSMRTYHPAMLTAARRLVEHWDRQAGSPVDVAGDMTRLTLDTIGLAGFGYDFGSFERSEPHPFVGAMLRTLVHTQTELRRPPGTRFLRWRAHRRFETDLALLHSVVDEVVRRRQQAGDTSTDDLLGLMLNARDAQGRPLDAANIRYQVITFLIAGHETTSGLLSFALYYLAKHPAVLARARAEVDTVLGDEPDPAPAFEQIGRFRYLRQVLNETLRLHPTAQIFERAARQDTLLGGRYPLRAGQGLLVLTPALHRQAAWGDNVNTFDPDRFTPERERARPPHLFKPFGTGERACIGRQFALHEAVLALALVVHRYRLLDHADYQLRIKDTLTVKPDGFQLVPLARAAGDRGAPVVTVRRPATTPNPTRTRADGRLRVLYGSNLGTCRELALRVAEEATERGFTPLVDRLDTAAGKLDPAVPLLVVAASYNGQPTDDAVGFTSWLRAAVEEPGEPVTGLEYAVLGVGDRNWPASFQRIPTQLDQGLAQLGGRRLVERGALDMAGDPVADQEEWLVGFWTALGAPAQATDRPAAESATGYRVRRLPAAAETAAATTAVLCERHDLVTATAVATRELVDTAHQLGRSKVEVRLRLPENTGYRTGDHLAVLPTNPAEQVELALRLTGLGRDELVEIEPPGSGRGGAAGRFLAGPVTAGQLLTRLVDLGAGADAARIRLLAELDPCPPERAQLVALAEQADAGQGRAAPSVLDLLTEHPGCRPELTELLRLWEPMRPRHYSISSSALASPGQVDLMVAVDRAGGSADSRPGTAAGYLAALAPGDQVLVGVRPCREAFRAPLDPGVPLVLVAAGTGLAPFRGLVADRIHRLAQAKPVPALCFFGCDHPDVDYLYRQELAAAERAGVVRIFPAFSALAEHGFVQHRLLAEADLVWTALQQGARVLVCGDGARMAPGVRQAFTTICRERTGCDADQADQWLAGLCESGRYVEDVYAP